MSVVIKMELILKFDFVSSHSLKGHETPHPHLWWLEFSLAGEPIEGKIIDIVELRERVFEMIAPMRGVYLNEFSGVTQSVREFPTCETLSVFFYERLHSLIARQFLSQNASLRISSLSVALCEMDGKEMGAVRLICK